MTAVLVTQTGTDSPIYAPSNGDPADAATFLTTTIQPIGNQLEFLKQRVRGVRQTEDIVLNATSGAARPAAWLPHVNSRPFMRAEAGSLTDNTDYALWIPLHHVLPISCKVSAFGCLLKGASGHTDLATTPPSVGFATMQRGNDSAMYDYLPVADTTATVAGYETIHPISISFAAGAELIVNRNAYEHWLVVTGEWGGAYAMSGLMVYNAFITVIPYGNW
jgi:hypothetical protein